jgi:hypothetical protein
MTQQRRALFSALILGSLAVLGACSRPLDRDQQDALSSCRTETDRVYNAQNRYQLSERDSSASPLSGTGSTLSQNSALADRYDYQRSIDSCVAAKTGK